MGICKCRRRTNLFCYAHRVAVCENCVCESEHTTCFVGTYRNWLEDSEFEQPSCGVCKGDLDNQGARQVLRVPCCLTLFHSECLDVYASSVPSSDRQTDQMVCPACKKPLIPDREEDTTLSRRMFMHLNSVRWAQHWLNRRRPATVAQGHDQQQQQQLEQQQHHHQHQHQQQLHHHVNHHSSLSFNPANSFQSSPNSSALGAPLLTSTPTGALVGWGEGPFARPAARQSPPTGAHQVISLDGSAAGSVAGPGGGRSGSPADFRDLDDDDKYRKKNRSLVWPMLGRPSALAVFAVLATAVMLLLFYISITS